jgi:hypothetical protein
VVGVGVVHAGRRDVVELLALPRRGLGDVNDFEDLEAAEGVICTARISRT